MSSKNEIEELKKQIWLRRNYKHMSNKEIEEQKGIPKSEIELYRNKFKLRKSKACMRRLQRKGAKITNHIRKEKKLNGEGKQEIVN